MPPLADKLFEFPAENSLASQENVELLGKDRDCAPVPETGQLFWLVPLASRDQSHRHDAR